jgi:hypothetical protein
MFPHVGGKCLENTRELHHCSAFIRCHVVYRADKMEVSAPSIDGRRQGRGSRGLALASATQNNTDRVLDTLSPPRCHSI